MYDSLKHFGILGMQWGKRNGPPYPLNPNKDYSAKEKKNRYKNLAKFGTGLVLVGIGAAAVSKLYSNKFGKMPGGMMFMSYRKNHPDEAKLFDSLVDKYSLYKKASKILLPSGAALVGLSAYGYHKNNKKKK